MAPKELLEKLYFRPYETYRDDLMEYLREAEEEAVCAFVAALRPEDVGSSRALLLIWQTTKDLNPPGIRDIESLLRKHLPHDPLQAALYMMRLG